MIFIKVFIMKWKGINKIIEVIEIFIEVCYCIRFDCLKV